MSTSTLHPSLYNDLDLIYQALKQQQAKQTLMQAAQAQQQSTTTTQQQLPMERKAVGSPVANRHYMSQQSTIIPSPTASPTKYNPIAEVDFLTAAQNNYNQQNQNHINNMQLSSIQQQQQPLTSPRGSTVQKQPLERSMSEPVGSDRISKNSNINPSRYKTEMCRPFEENGSCKYGDKCQFAHGSHEQRNLARHPKYKTELCRTFHTIGFCPYGPRCHFIHNEDERKLNCIIQQKQQQALAQAAQQVAQQQALQQQQEQFLRATLSGSTTTASKPVRSQQPQHPHVALSMPTTTASQFTMRDLLHARDLLGSTADSPPASVTDSPQSLSPTFSGSDLDSNGVFSPCSSFGSSSSSSSSTASSSLGSTALTPPPGLSVFTYPQEQLANQIAATNAQQHFRVMSPLNVQTNVQSQDPLASLAAGIQAALLNPQVRNSTASSHHHQGAPVATNPFSCDSLLSSRLQGNSKCDEVMGDFLVTPPSPPDSINGDAELEALTRQFRLPIFSQLAD